jgi:hypothetical protein
MTNTPTLTPYIITPTPTQTMYTFGELNYSGPPVVLTTGTTYAQRYEVNPAVDSTTNWGVYMYLDSPATCIFGVYNDGAGGQYPGSILYESAPVTSGGTGIVAWFQNSPLAEGDYWLAYEFLGTGTVTCASPSASSALVSYVPVGFPAAWPGCASGANPPPACAPPPSAAVNQASVFTYYYQ